MKTLVSAIFIVILHFISAQDTLYFPSGEIQLVELIWINKEAGLIKYNVDGRPQIRNTTSLKSYTNHAQLNDGKWDLVEGMPEADSTLIETNHASRKDPSKYRYGKYSVGANLLSCLSSAGSTFDQAVASNFNLSLYGLYTLNKNFGLRAPVRIGFNQLRDTVYNVNSEAWKHERDLIGEGGIEFLVMRDDNRTVNPYFLPGFYMGVNRGVISFYNDSTYQLIKYFPTSKHRYFRIGFTVGCQFNFSKTIQLNTECGFNINNTRVSYYQYGSGLTGSNTYGFIRFGWQAAVNLVYRFGGRLRE